MSIQKTTLLYRLTPVEGYPCWQRLSHLYHWVASVLYVDREVVLSASCWRRDRTMVLPCLFHFLIQMVLPEFLLELIDWRRICHRSLAVRNSHYCLFLFHLWSCRYLRHRLPAASTFSFWRSSAEPSLSPARPFQSWMWQYWFHIFSCSFRWADRRKTFRHWWSTIGQVRSQMSCLQYQLRQDVLCFYRFGPLSRWASHLDASWGIRRLKRRERRRWVYRWLISGKLCLQWRTSLGTKYWHLCSHTKGCQ